MTSKTTNMVSPEVRGRAVRMVLDQEGEQSLPRRRGWPSSCRLDQPGLRRTEIPGLEAVDHLVQSVDLL